MSSPLLGRCLAAESLVEIAQLAAALLGDMNASALPGHGPVERNAEQAVSTAIAAVHEPDDRAIAGFCTP